MCVYFHIGNSLAKYIWKNIYEILTRTVQLPDKNTPGTVCQLVFLVRLLFRFYSLWALNEGGLVIQTVVQLGLMHIKQSHQKACYSSFFFDEENRFL